MTKENRTKEILVWGGRPWKIKFDSTREYAVVTKEILTKDILPWGGGPLEKKIKFNQGIRCRYQRNSH